MSDKPKKPLTSLQKRLKKIMRQISGDVEDLSGTLIPETIIVGDGVIYCYSPSAREFVKINRGTRIYILKHYTDKVLIYTIDGHIVEIDEDELLFIGFD